MSLDTPGPYIYDILPFEQSFRVAELLPGSPTDQVICRLHSAEWHQRPQYDAVSYIWGDPNERARIRCDGRWISITNNLYQALVRFRDTRQSRIIWADGLCINQENIPERGLQVRQIKVIYEKAQQVLVWLGQDNGQAETAVQTIYSISEFLSKELDLFMWQHNSNSDTYQEIVLRNRHRLPVPQVPAHAVDALVWFFSHRYFTRIWAIQEATANDRCTIYLSSSHIAWPRVDLTACYLIMDQTYSDKHGFSNTKCWHVATFAEIAKRPANWLNTLYLASNFSCADARDVVYGLRGLLALQAPSPLLEPDYSKSVNEVYRDCAEAALVDTGRTDVLLYVTGRERPSWVPRWDVAMLFRNPFRFGKSVPWKPTSIIKAEWSVDRATSTLQLTGSVADTIAAAEPYNQLWSSDNRLTSPVHRAALREWWTQVLNMLRTTLEMLPLSASTLTSLAVSLSSFLSQALDMAWRQELIRQLIAYLLLVSAQNVAGLESYISASLLDDSRSRNA